MNILENKNGKLKYKIHMLEKYNEKYAEDNRISTGFCWQHREVYKP